MAYDESAAKSTHSAETSSPRCRASTVQHTAPTTAIPPQIAMAWGVILLGVCRCDVDVDIETSELVRFGERTGLALSTPTWPNPPQHSVATDQGGHQLCDQAGPSSQPLLLVGQHHGAQSCVDTQPAKRLRLPAR